MSEPLQLSSNVLTFYLDGVNKKFYTKITFRNQENFRKGFKIKTSNRDRYIVNPASTILLPFQSVEVDFALALREETSNPHEINRDKFCVYVIVLDDGVHSKQDVEEYIRSKRVDVKKIYLKVNAISAAEGELSTGNQTDNQTTSAIFDSSAATSPQKPSAKSSNFLSMGNISEENSTNLGTLLMTKAAYPMVDLGKNVQNSEHLSNKKSGAPGEAEFEEEIKKLRDLNKSLEKELKFLRVI